MSGELPSDLIIQSQIHFREDAGLSSLFQTLASLPTLQDSISGLHPSSSIRCTRCKGKLLMGSKSLICIHCGQCQTNHLPPHPIFFKSTAAYRWLLNSLEFTGMVRVFFFFCSFFNLVIDKNLIRFERIGSLDEEYRKAKGGTPAEDLRTVSEILDLQITWRDECEKPEIDFVDKTFDSSTISLEFSKGGWEDFVTESQRGIVFDAFEEQLVTSEAGLNNSVIGSQSESDDSDDVVDEHNLSLFQNVLSAAISSNHKGESSSSGSEVEIGSVNSEIQNEDSKITSVSPELRGDSSSGDDAEVRSVNSGTLNEDANPAAISSDLINDSLSGDDAEVQSENSAIENEDSKIAGVSSDLHGDSLSGDDAEIESMNSETENKDSEAAAVASDLKEDYSPVNSTTENEDPEAAAVSSDLKEDYSPVNSTTENEDPEAAAVSSDLKEDSSPVNSTTGNEDPEAAAVSSDLKEDSSPVNSMREIEDSEAVAVSSDLKEDSSPVNSRTQDEDLNGASVPSDLREDSSPAHDAENQSSNLRAQIEDSKSDASSSDSSGESSSEDEIEIPTVESLTQFDDSNTVGSPPDNVSTDTSSAEDAEIQSVDSMAQNDDDPEPADLNGDYSSGDDQEEAPSVDSEVAADPASPDFRGDDSSGDDAEIQSPNSETQNADSKTSVSGDDDADI
ncbi:hypothetical protein OSB04_015928 [Centaurea solstitialis]|uniref:DUF7815 domain-containing protein n=1 Tax=Centaurea solstitialis TaxID=347529 RepID=A0AA38T7Q9_9ASTR|nr:hypothetical protein OSB04_015928 [Centaurea solstitialis]